MATHSSVLAWKIYICIQTHTHIYRASLEAPLVKNLLANAGDTREAGLIPGLGRWLGGEYGNPLQYSCLGIPMDRGAWQATAHGVAELDMTELTHMHAFTCIAESLSSISKINTTLNQLYLKKKIPLETLM